MSRGIKPGVMCIVIRSRAGNEGREAEVIRPVKCLDRIPEIGDRMVSLDDGWLVKAKYPFNTKSLVPEPGDDFRYGTFPPSALLPLHPGPDALDIDEAAPVNTSIPSLTPA